MFNGVYKVVAVEDKEGNITPRIKVSDNLEKITTPHFKKIFRLYDSDGKAIADQICVYDETIDDTKPLRIFDPDATWKSKVIRDFKAKELMVPVIKDGKVVYDMPSLTEIREYCARQMDTLWDEVKRFANPHQYYVDLSQKLWDVKDDLLRRSRSSTPE